MASHSCGALLVSTVTREWVFRYVVPANMRYEYLKFSESLFSRVVEVPIPCSEMLRKDAPMIEIKLNNPRSPCGE